MDDLVSLGDLEFKLGDDFGGSLIDDFLEFLGEFFLESLGEFFLESLGDDFIDSFGDDLLDSFGENRLISLGDVFLDSIGEYRLVLPGDGDGLDRTLGLSTLGGITSSSECFLSGSGELLSSWSSSWYQMKSSSMGTSPRSKRTSPMKKSSLSPLFQTVTSMDRLHS